MKTRKPNWSKWNLIEDAKVWQVVALSFDINPDEVTRSSSDWMAGGSFVNHEGQDFKDRLDVISANYLKIDANPKTLSMNGIAYCEINIPKFAEWAMSVNWEIPEELKRRVTNLDEISEEKVAQIFDKANTTYPPELDIAVQAWQVVSKTQGKGKPKTRIREWLDSNTSLSNEAKERISIVANWDKIGGAARTQ
ncbi:MAG TPA: hypothetical protein VIE91_04950 [Methylophilaceae bacterium]|jgi:hypothetical protein